jgi:tRNA dimethylallyltransferase
MVNGLPPLALIAGPTASGKSALAVELARRSNGVIVNADSAQIYCDVPILSAAPSPEDHALAEHRLYGIRDGADPCSAADWASLAKAEIAEIQSAGRLPILVGGTGLYLRTLLDGIAPVPPIEPSVRSSVRGAGTAENLARLVTLDPVAATTLNPGDTTRIARALEVVLSTGKTLRAWQSRRTGGIGDRVDLRPIILLPPRPWLYRRCDRRFETMLDHGAVVEAERLAARHLDPQLPVMRAIGLAELMAFAAGRMTRAEALAVGAQSTRRYAKRQYTWFAHQPPADWPRFDRALDEPGAIEAALALLMRSG